MELGQYLNLYGPKDYSKLLSSGVILELFDKDHRIS